MSCVLGRKHGSNLTLLWLWHRAPILPVAWQFSYAMGAALKRKRKKKVNHKNSILFIFIYQQCFIDIHLSASESAWETGRSIIKLPQHFFVIIRTWNILVQFKFVEYQVWSRHCTWLWEWKDSRNMPWRTPYKEYNSPTTSQVLWECCNYVSIEQEKRPLALAKVAGRKLLGSDKIKAIAVTLEKFDNF